MGIPVFARAIRRRRAQGVVRLVRAANLLASAALAASCLGAPAQQPANQQPAKKMAQISLTPASTYSVSRVEIASGVGPDRPCDAAQLRQG